METIIICINAYASYLIAEAISVSGIVSILFCGIVLAHYCYHNLSEDCRIFSAKFFELIAALCDTLIFIYLGLAVFSFEKDIDWGLTPLTCVIIILARCCQVFPLSFLVNLTRSSTRKIPMQHQIFISYAGLRGGMAYVLALAFYEEHESDSSKRFMTTTLGVVFFTILGLAAGMIPLLDKLKIPTNVDYDKLVTSVDPDKKKKQRFLDIDRQWIKPFLTNKRYNRSDYEKVQDDVIEMQAVETIGEEMSPQEHQELTRIESKDSLERDGKTEGKDEKKTDV